MTALKIQNLAKDYGSVQALKGISFDVEQGEFFALLGPNGAGKSTLISIVAGLVRATSGSASVMGHNVVSDYRQARQSVGIVPQEVVYDPFFPVEDLLKLQAGYYGVKNADAWIDRLLTALDLQDKRKANMRQLSGGMKRRVLIAQALVHRPPVVILDEPTAGVDVELRRTLWDFTRELHAEGHTIVLTTHYLEEAEALCSRVAVVDKGELRALETTPELLSRHPYRMVRLKVEGGVLPDALADKVVETTDAGVELRLHKDNDNLGDVLNGLRDAGVNVQDLSTREPSLEDVFVELTGGQA